MADFDAPTGPPPPKVPEGWVARWNDQYKEWFYVNTYTKKSQWEKPTEPAIPPRDDAPAGPPPSYTAGDNKPVVVSDAKVNPYDNTNQSTTGGASGSGTHQTESEDERLARQLQAEEDARARSHGGTTTPQQSFPGQLPPRPDNLDG